MLFDFFFTVRKAGVPASVKEFLTLLEALDKGVVYGSIDDFYTLSRMCLVKDEAYFDRFDLAFAQYFKGVAAIPDGIVTDIPADWLKLLLAEDIPPEALRSEGHQQAIPPLYGALLKNEQDVHLFERVAFMARTGR